MIGRYAIWPNNCCHMALPRNRNRSDTPPPPDDFLYSTWTLETAALRVSEGLATTSLYRVKDNLGLSNRELAHLVQIPARTLARRLGDERLPPDESERVYRIARLLEVAARVLGSTRAASEWMREPNFALGEQIPLTLSRTEPGAFLVERLLVGIERGLPV